jgi:hypothetical protein
VEEKMTSSLSTADVTCRASDLDRWEKALRQKMIEGGVSEWAFGDLIRLTLADVQSLLARVAELEAERASKRDEPSVVGALIGSLRAAGYQVTEPDVVAGYREAFAPTAVGHDDVPAAHPLIRAAESAPLDPVPDDVAKDLDWELEAHRREATVCPNCDQPLPPDGKCRSSYVDCQKASAPPVEPAPTAPYPVLAEGMAIRFTYGLYEGRYAFITGRGGHDGGNWVARLWTGAAPPSTAVDIPHDKDARPILVENPDPPPVVTSATSSKPQTDPPTAAEAPAAKARQRAEEPPVAIADWSLTDKDLAEVAAKLGRTVDEVKRLVAEFKVAMKTRAPTPRWRPAFNAWLAKNAPAVLAQTTIPGA